MTLTVVSLADAAVNRDGAFVAMDDPLDEAETDTGAVARRVGLEEALELDRIGEQVDEQPLQPAGVAVHQDGAVAFSSLDVNGAVSSINQG